MLYVVVGIICSALGFAVAWFLSAFLCTSRFSRFQGRFIVNSKNPEEDVFSIEFNTPIAEMIDDEIIVLKVDKDI